MAIFILDPAADGQTGMTVQNAASGWEAINDGETHNGTVDYLRVAGTGTSTDRTFYVPNVSSGDIPDDSVINSVSVLTTTQQSTGAGKFTTLVGNGTTEILTTDQYDCVPNVWTDHTLEFLTDPMTGLAWDLATLRGWAAGGATPREFGVRSTYYNGTGQNRMTRARILVDWTESETPPAPVTGSGEFSWNVAM